MFRRKKRWLGQAMKSLFFAAILYRIARSFMKTAEKQAGKPYKKKREKG